VKHYLVIGDSHSWVFDYYNSTTKTQTFDVCSVRGATAYGLMSSGSSTGANIKYTSAIEDSNRRNIIFMLGEVDCGFLIWAHGDPDGHVFKRSLERYQSFIADYALNKFEEIIVCAVIPPFVESYVGDKQRGKADSSLLDRWHLTSLFNKCMSQWCADNGVRFISIEKDIVRNGRVLKKYCKQSPSEWHLEEAKTCPLWIKQLTKA